MNDLVSVIIPTCGNRDYFVSCLESLARQAIGLLEVIVINNSLDPELSAKVQKLYPAAKIILPGRNLFYGRSLNRGIAASSGDFVLCLNDDVVLDKDFIKEALKGFERDEKIGMVSGKILRSDRITLDSTGLFLSPWRTARERGYGKRDQGQFQKAGAIFGVCGAAAFYRRKMLDDVRAAGVWFDPRFKMFYEDLDLAWRANRQGWKGYYVPSAVAYHVRGGSVRAATGQGKAMARRYLNNEWHEELIKNRHLTIHKNETTLGFFFHLIPIVLYDLCVWFYLLFLRSKSGNFFKI